MTTLTYYIVELEELADVSIHVIDLRVAKTNTFYRVELEFNGNYLSSTRLDLTSAHVPSVHVGCPKARMKALLKLSSSPSAARNAMDKLINMFRLHYANLELVT